VLAGWLGLLVAGVCFIGPTMLDSNDWSKIPTKACSNHYSIRPKLDASVFVTVISGYPL
jgi:hypothetical protein